MIKKILYHTFFLVFLLPATLVNAHSKDVARFEIQQDGQNDYLVIYFSLAAVEDIFQNQFNFDQEGSEEQILKLKSLTAKYVKSLIDIKVNDTLLVFGEGAIDLGHASIMKLDIKNLPHKINFVEAEIRCFHEIENERNIFVINTDSLQYKATLTDKNHFRDTMTVHDTISIYRSKRFVLVLGLCVVFITVAVFLWNPKRISLPLLK